jgi:peptidoglycan/LPS O-acetylase OafA/YrhL
VSADSAAGKGALSPPDAPKGETTISQAGERRDAYIESLRALGSILVVFAHIAVVSFALLPYNPQVNDTSDLVARFLYGTGNVALFLFFAISGFAIYMPFAKRDFGGGGPVNLRRYAVNRALRILPLYYVVVATVLIIDYNWGSFGLWARFLSFSQNFNPRTVFEFIGPSWSLVVELHFYLLLPLLAWGIARVAKGSIARAIAILGAVALACVVFRILTVAVPEFPNPVWRASTPANLQFIIAGMIAALAYIYLQQNRPRWLQGALTNSDLWLLAAAVVTIPFTWIAFYYDSLQMLTAFLIIGAAAFPHLQRGPVTRVFWWKPLAILGLASYSIYLWHIYVLEFFLKRDVLDFGPLVATVLPVSIIVGLISYKLIEEPFLRLRRRWSPATPKQEQPATAAAAKALGGA